LLHLLPLHLPNATWFSLWGAFLLAHWGGLSWVNHCHPGVWLWNLGSLNPFSNNMSKTRLATLSKQQYCIFKTFWASNINCTGLSTSYEETKPCFLLWPFFDQLINLTYKYITKKTLL
jgi:hypothetical protein